ncbi:unnamed protein product (macronuclear) [Paramecium tetraurelia]|uniref:Uncharacterized protein n=1 Tax=Paramecium tetraurelia TaxID=5888 RepID=A0C170_PARTE|nr:uncharacterized protein GSPATT00034013001 [Paramecium tetraurelia]CAK64537.1 unnamed protein product [Paramecium tetraurelia]|eukprot:XP_001431935.1 hypothetical protein (macronuclear) [Paramecium tetraurelia strain d4-2]
MKTFMLLGLLSLTFAVSISNQGTLSNPTSRVERIMSKFMQLSEMSTQFNFNKLFDAIDQLSAQLKQSEVDENNLFDADFAQYVEDQAFYTDLVTFYTAEVAQHTEDLRSLNNHLESYQQQLTQRQEELDRTQKQKAQLEETIRQNEITYNKQISDFNTAIDVLDQAIQLLSGLRNPVLIQTEQDQLKTLAGKFSSINLKNHRVLYQPIIDIFMQLSQNNLANQDLLKKVLGMLNGLRNSLDGGRNALTSNYNSERASNLELLESYTKKIDALVNEVIPMLQDLIANTIEQIKVKTELLNNAQANLDEAKETLQFIEDRWVKRKAQHAALLAEYEKEQALIAQTITVLQRGGVRRQ